MYKTDSGKYFKPVPAGYGHMVPDGGTGITGPTAIPTIDLMGYDSGKLAIEYRASIAATGATGAINVTYATSDNDSTWNTAVAVGDYEVAEGPVSSDVDIIEYDMYVGDKPRYLKFNITPDFSAYSGTATDLISYQAMFIKGGPDSIPAV